MVGIVDVPLDDGGGESCILCCDDNDDLLLIIKDGLDDDKLDGPFVLPYNVKTNFHEVSNNAP